MLYWCETCAKAVCGHCALLNGEHIGHSMNTIASKHAELRTHAATLTPRITALANQLDEETARTATLRERAEVLQTELQARAASFSELAVAPYAAQLELLKTFMSQTAAREAKALVSANKTLSAVDDFKNALSVARLHSVLSRPPNSSGSGSGSNNGEMRTLAHTPWVAARAAFEASLANAVETVTPRTAVCEVDVPLSALASPAAAVELGTAELCGVAFVCRVRRGCSCGTAPLLLQSVPQSSTTSASASANASASASASANASASVSASAASANASASACASESMGAVVEGADASRALAPCACAIVGEIEARTALDAIAARYNECAARVKAVSELIETGDDDDDDDDEDVSGGVSNSGLAAKDIVFGTVCAEFALAGAAADNQTVEKCSVLLTDPNKRVVAVALAKHADLNGVSSANDGSDGAASAVRVRCAIAFPDVFHQARALQLCVDAMAVEFVAAQQALAQSSAAAKATVEAEAVAAKSTREAEELQRQVKDLKDLHRFVKSDEDADREFLEALNKHAAHVQETGGYPIRCQTDHKGNSCPCAPAPMCVNGAPSPATLLTLQAKARKNIVTLATECIGEENLASDVIMRFYFHGGVVRDRVTQVVIRLYDDIAPFNAIHFRVAAAAQRLGRNIHRCYAPANQVLMKTPLFVTFSSLCCIKSPITVPVGDILYGENMFMFTSNDFDAASDERIYPVGTVLMCASAVPFSPDKARHNSPSVPNSGHTTIRSSHSSRTIHVGGCDTPWFLVIEACAASLLPGGAVPVGRVLSTRVETRGYGDDENDTNFLSTLQKQVSYGCAGNQMIVQVLDQVHFWKR